MVEALGVCGKRATLKDTPVEKMSQGNKQPVSVSLILIFCKCSSLVKLNKNLVGKTAQ